MKYKIKKAKKDDPNLQKKGLPLVLLRTTSNQRKIEG